MKALNHIVTLSARDLGIEGVEVASAGLLKNQAGESILQYCLYDLCSKGYEGIVRREIEGLRGSGVLDASGPNGSTALHGAAYWGQSGIVKMLLEVGCDTEKVNTIGEYALDNALHPSEEAKLSVESYLDTANALLSVATDEFLVDFIAQGDRIVCICKYSHPISPTLGVYGLTALLKEASTRGIRATMPQADFKKCEKHLRALQDFDAAQALYELQNLLSNGAERGK